MDRTNEEGVVLEVLNAVLAQSVLSAADEPADQVLGVLRHVGDLLRELEALLGQRGRALEAAERTCFSLLLMSSFIDAPR